MTTSANHDQHAPFFVVGSVRTGTTLLRVMLGHHSQICRCEEMEFVASALNGTDEWPEMPTYRHTIEHDRGFRLTGYQIDATLDFKRLAHSFLEQRHRIDDRPLIGATVHNHFDELPRVWPNARYIFLNRDPRDVARSCVAMGFVGTPWRGAEMWLAAQEAWERLTSIVPIERRMELKFENLVEDPANELTKICAFLGVDFEPTMTAIDGDTTYMRPSTQQAKSWRISAQPWEIRQIEARIGAPRMSESGYAPSGSPAHVGPLDRLMILVQDLFNRVRFRIDRYGFWLWAAGVVTRRLRFAKPHDSIKLRLDAIDNANMR